MFSRLRTYAGAAACVLSLGLLVLLAQAPGALAANKNPHDYNDKGSCSACHKQKVPDLKFDAVTVCTRCHEGYLGNHPVAKHPIGKRPNINISRLMPLSLDGRMVCYTCHDNHNRSAYPNMLRTEYLRLCSACHRGY